MSGSSRRAIAAAVVVTALALSSVAIPTAATAAGPAAPQRVARRLPSGATECRLHGAGGASGYWSACFPTLHMDISWDGFDFVTGAEDKGSEVGTQATNLFVFDRYYGVYTEQSSKLDDRAQITGTMSDPDCGEDATPSYDGHGSGLLETGVLADYFEGWGTHGGGNPTNADWAPNVDAYQVSYPNCDGGSIPESYSPGTPSYGYRCPTDRRKHPEFDLYFGKYSSTGTLAKGVHDTWNFDCTFEPTEGWTSSGQVRMVENPCPRIAKGQGFRTLGKSTKAALGRLFTKLNAEGGCYQFALGWLNPRTHAQNAEIFIGFRPAGLQVFADSPDLQKYIVPVLHRIAKSAGLCGPAAADPTHFQMPYKTGNEEKPSCHLRA